MRTSANPAARRGGRGSRSALRRPRRPPHRTYPTRIPPPPLRRGRTYPRIPPPSLPKHRKTSRFPPPTPRPPDRPPAPRANRPSLLRPNPHRNFQDLRHVRRPRPRPAAVRGTAPGTTTPWATAARPTAPRAPARRRTATPQSMPPRTTTPRPAAPGRTRIRPAAPRTLPPARHGSLFPAPVPMPAVRPTDRPAGPMRRLCSPDERTGWGGCDPGGRSHPGSSPTGTTFSASSTSRPPRRPLRPRLWQCPEQRRRPTTPGSRAGRHRRPSTGPALTTCSRCHWVSA